MSAEIKDSQKARQQAQGRKIPEGKEHSQGDHESRLAQKVPGFRNVGQARELCVSQAVLSRVHEILNKLPSSDRQQSELGDRIQGRQIISSSRPFFSSTFFEQSDEEQAQQLVRMYQRGDTEFEVLGSSQIVSLT